MRPFCDAHIKAEVPLSCREIERGKGREEVRGGRMNCGLQDTGRVGRRRYDRRKGMMQGRGGVHIGGGVGV